MSRLEKISPELRERLYHRRYIAPNLVTVGNLFCGFLTIIYASSGRYEKAVLAIIVAIVLDGLDGNVARRLNATSRFGVEFDSFSDLVSFGVGPAILIYNWCFKALADEFGVFISFIYVICAASRLARFNLAKEDLKGFDGLPSPAAAALVAAVVNLLHNYTPDRWGIAFGTSVMLLAAYLMVSKYRYVSAKQFNVRGIPVRARIFVGMIVALIWYKPYFGFLGVAGLYALSGPILTAWDLFTKEEEIERDREEEQVDPSSETEAQKEIAQEF